MRPGTVRAQSAPAIGLDSPLWRLESSTNGVALFSAPAHSSGLIPFKAVMSIPGTIAEVSMVLEDIARRRDWIARYGESRLLERTSDYEQLEYLRVVMPWPVAHRTTLIRVRITVSDDQRTATIAAASVDSSARDTLPVHVRAHAYASTFQMTQQGDRVEVASLVFIDPRGHIPKWVVNYFTSGVARTTLEGLRRQVARHLYPGAELAAMQQRIAAYHTHRELRASAPE